jgi:hypothetical protein
MKGKRVDQSHPLISAIPTKAKTATEQDGQRRLAARRERAVLNRVRPPHSATKMIA